MDLLTLPLWSALVQRGSEELGYVLRTSQRLSLQEVWNAWRMDTPPVDHDYLASHLCLAPAWMRWYGEWEREWEEKDTGQSIGGQLPPIRCGILVESVRLRWQRPETMAPAWHNLLHTLITGQRNTGVLSDEQGIAALAVLDEPHSTLETITDLLPPTVRNAITSLTSATEWLVHLTLFFGVYVRGAWFPCVVGYTLFCIDATGQIIKGEDFNGVHTLIPGLHRGPWQYISLHPSRLEHGWGLLRMAVCVFYRTQLTLFSPHEYVAVRPSRPVRRAAERNGEPLPCSFSILRIGGRAPSRTRPAPVLSARGQRARHVQRGHFKRYLGKRLFGRWSGVWYWQEGRPGGAPRVLAKDYVILPSSPRSVNFTSR